MRIKNERERIETMKVLARIVRLGRSTATMMGLALMVAVVLGVATTALGAVPGDPFRLGKVNAINTVSRLVGGENNAMLSIDNTSAGASATALDLRVEPGKAPMKVNSTTRVANLNSDRIDDKSANQLVRVASFTGESPLASGTNGTLATTTINAPASGFLVIEAGSDVTNIYTSENATCFIEVDGLGLLSGNGSERAIRVDGATNVNEDEDCSTNTVVPVAAGTHTVDLEVRYVDQPKTHWGSTALSAIYIPFDGTGASPSSAAISAAQEEAATPEHKAREDGGLRRAAIEEVPTG